MKLTKKKRQEETDRRGKAGQGKKGHRRTGKDKDRQG